MPGRPGGSARTCTDCQVGKQRSGVAGQPPHHQPALCVPIATLHLHHNLPSRFQAKSSMKNANYICLAVVSPGTARCPDCLTGVQCRASHGPIRPPPTAVHSLSRSDPPPPGPRGVCGMPPGHIRYSDTRPDAPSHVRSPHPLHLWKSTSESQTSCLPPPGHHNALSVRLFLRVTSGDQPPVRCQTETSCLHLLSPFICYFVCRSIRSSFPPPVRPPPCPPPRPRLPAHLSPCRHTPFHPTSHCLSCQGLRPALSWHLEQVLV